MLEEKRKKREEAKKAAEEAKRKKLAAKGATPAAEPEEPKEETCIIDNLLKEIRAGTTLKPTGKGSVRQRRRASQLKKGDLQKLNQIVEKAATTPHSKEAQFRFPAVPEQDENDSNTVSKSNGAEIQTSDQQAVENVGERSNGDSASVQTEPSHSQNADAHVSTTKGSPSVASTQDNIPAHNHVAVANGESGSPSKGEAKSVPVTKAESSAQPKIKAKSVPVEDARVPVTNGENNTRLEVEANSVLVANGRSDAKLKVGEDRHAPVVNGKTNARLRVETKSVKTGAQGGSGTVPPKTQSERQTSPRVGDTAAKSPSLPTHRANDHFPHEKGTPICQTIRSSDGDVGGSLKEDRDRMSQSKGSSETSLSPMVSSIA